ncbi:carbonate dehydratase [Fodinibius halophilus]|uniref:Carbonic anhydrase n=1 Tax=Fodinibius halophilus TaxID=1736908 RepID=A0A6M1TBK8_9BACT|nr:carbonate dehydratase [Fodinibius halophilus]
MNTPTDLLDQNKEWANRIKKEDPNFFKQLSKGQSPNYLWIGCADSRVPASQVIDLAPGDMFVHRNIANVIAHTDFNSLSVIQYAVAVLKVEHVIICGHYGCGGVKAAFDDQSHGLIDNWLRHIQDVGRLHSEELENLSEEDKLNRLCELNVAEQVRNLCQTPIVQNAWNNGQDLNVHGWIYSLAQGEIADLKLTASSNNDLS